MPRDILSKVKSRLTQPFKGSFLDTLPPGHNDKEPWNIWKDDRILGGLANTGNTCYMNSALQFLFAARPFIYMYAECGDAMKIPGSSFNTKLVKLVREMQNSRAASYSTAREFKQVAAKGHREFYAFGQQDSLEYFLHMLVKIEEHFPEELNQLKMNPCDKMRIELCEEIKRGDDVTYVRRVEYVISSPLSDKREKKDNSTTSSEENSLASTEEDDDSSLADKSKLPAGKNITNASECAGAERSPSRADHHSGIHTHKDHTSTPNVNDSIKKESTVARENMSRTSVEHARVSSDSPERDGSSSKSRREDRKPNPSGREGVRPKLAGGTNKTVPQNQNSKESSGKGCLKERAPGNKRDVPSKPTSLQSTPPALSATSKPLHGKKNHSADTNGAQDTNSGKVSKKTAPTPSGQKQQSNKRPPDSAPSRNAKRPANKKNHSNSKMEVADHNEDQSPGNEPVVDASKHDDCDTTETSPPGNQSIKQKSEKQDNRDGSPGKKLDAAESKHQKKHNENKQYDHTKPPGEQTQEKAHKCDEEEDDSHASSPDCSAKKGKRSKRRRQVTTPTRDLYSPENSRAATRSPPYDHNRWMRSCYSDPPLHVNLKDCIRKFMTQEQVLTAGRKPVFKTSRIATFPEYLVFQLRIFVVNSWGYSEKLRVNAKVPDELNLCDWKCDSNWIEKSKEEMLGENRTQTDYRLKAFVTHHGWSPRSGHYVCHVKHGDQWYKCNDSSVWPTDVDESTKSTGYFYLYERCDVQERFRSSKEERIKKKANVSEKQEKKERKNLSF